MGQIAAQLVQSRLDNQCALCIKQIVISTLTAIASRNLTKPSEGIAVVAKEIAVAIYRPPLSGNRLSCPVITATGADRDPVSSHQNMIRKGIAQVLGVLLAVFGDHCAYCLNTVNRLECSRIKIIILTASIGGFDLTPAVLGLAVDGIVQIILVGKQSGYLSDRDTVRAKIVPIFTGFTSQIAGELMKAGQYSAVLPVGPLSVFLDPAVLGILLQLEAVCELRNGIKEMGSVVSVDILAVVIGIQTIFDLIFFLLCQRFQNMEVCIDVIAEIAADRAVKQSVFVPCCAVRGDKLQAAEYAKRVCSCGVDRFALLNEVADDRQLIVLHLGRGHGEILVCQTELGCIDRNAFRCGQCDRDRRQGADTLGKLQQEIPCCASLLSAAGEHIQKRRKLLRDRHLGHIHCKGRGCFHSGLRINLVISLLVFFII